ncbi:MAG: NifB/NifX family molybdenum-iron cluster-binding protein [Candidatus Zixiibacteriota bacterium]
MKACIPVESDSGPNARIAPHFGTAPFYALYESDSKSLRFATNKNPHKGHGACDPREKIGDADIDCILCASMGKRAIEKFGDQNIAIYKTDAETLSELLPTIHSGNVTVLEPTVGCADHNHEESCNPSDCIAGGDCSEGGCQPPERFDV